MTDSNDIHVTPINDLKEHIEVGMKCWCKPIRDQEEPSVIVHNALDNREVQEWWDENISGSKDEPEPQNVPCQDFGCENLVWRELACKDCHQNFCNYHMEGHVCQ